MLFVCSHENKRNSRGIVSEQLRDFSEKLVVLLGLVVLQLEHKVRVLMLHVGVASKL